MRETSPQSPPPPSAAPSGETDRSSRLGTQFRAARERQGIALDAAARTLRISLRVLAAMEQGHFDDLPADVYARGFVKAYAEYLGLDVEDSLALYVAERAAQTPAVAPAISAVLRPLRRRRFFSSRFTVLGGTVVVVIAVLLYLFVELRGFTRAPDLRVTDPSRDTESSTNTLVVRGQADPTAEVRINGERTFVREDGTFEETLGMGEGVNTIRITATSVGGRERVVTREVLVRPSASPSPTPSEGPSPVPDVQTPFRLAVNVIEEPVWLSLSADGETRFSGLLLPGSRQEVTGRTIQITSGKGARTHIVIDDEDRGVLSPDSGVVRDVTFTRIRCISSSGAVASRRPFFVVVRTEESCPAGSTPAPFTSPSPSATVDELSPSP